MTTGVIGSLLERESFHDEQDYLKKRDDSLQNFTSTNHVHSPARKLALGQKLLEMQRLYPVHILGPSTDIDTILASLKQLDSLIDGIKSLSEEERVVGSSPGFYTGRNSSSKKENVDSQQHSSFLWEKPPGQETDDGSSSVYEVLDLNKNTYSVFKLPVPSPADALRCYEKIREVWKARLEWVKTVNSGGCTENVCACIKSWKHFHGNVLLSMANQMMEQVNSLSVTIFVGTWEVSN